MSWASPPQAFEVPGIAQPSASVPMQETLPPSAPQEAPSGDGSSVQPPHALTLGPTQATDLSSAQLQVAPQALQMPPLDAAPQVERLPKLFKPL